MSNREKSEREKQVSYINAYMWNLGKMVQMNLFIAKQKWRRRCREPMDGHQRGRRVGMDWEVGIDIYTLLCMKRMAVKNLLYSTGWG